MAWKQGAGGDVTIGDVGCGEGSEPSPRGGGIRFGTLTAKLHTILSPGEYNPVMCEEVERESELSYWLGGFLDCVDIDFETAMGEIWWLRYALLHYLDVVNEIEDELAGVGNAVDADASGGPPAA
jgi:hypothetical protein